MVGLRMKTAHIQQHIVRAHGNHALSKSAIYRWAKRFRQGDLSLEDKPRPSRPQVLSNAVVPRIQNAVHVSPNISLRALSQACGVSIRTVHKALRKRLNLCKRPSRWVPHELTDNQKRRRVLLCRRNLAAIRRNPAVLTHLVTGDKSWFLTYDPTQKRASMAWLHPNDPCPPKVRRDQRAVKAMLVLFFDIQGVVSRQFVPRGQGVNAHEYLRHLRTLRTNIRRCRPQMWPATTGSSTTTGPLPTMQLQSEIS